MGGCLHRHRWLSILQANKLSSHPAFSCRPVDTAYRLWYTVNPHRRCPHHPRSISISDAKTGWVGDVEYVHYSRQRHYDLRIERLAKEGGGRFTYVESIEDVPAAITRCDVYRRSQHVRVGHPETRKC